MHAVHAAAAWTSQGSACRQRAHQLARTLGPDLCVNELPRGTLRFAAQPDSLASHVSPNYQFAVSGFAFSRLVP
jgi:cysteine sulfinate desulfinase/cysteine desulfurase-like protein